MDTNSGRVNERISQIIEEQSEEIERRWLETVQRDVVKTPGVELTLLRDGMPDYLIELAKALKNSTTSTQSLDRLAESAWTKVAREHGITRVRLGFDISQLVHEFVVLRRVIYEVVHTQELAFGQAESLLADLLDAAISAAVEAYVGARDYEARRAQAANIGFLTHELRQPLSMAMFAAASLRRCIADEDAHVLDTLDRGLGGLADLIDSVLLTQKLEVGEVNVQPTEITMSQLMEPVESLRRTAEQKGLRFHVTYDPELRVVVDPTLTRSAIQNLAENAVKYTDSGEVEISVAHTADEVIVDVRDTCRGISAEELRTIFQPFKRGRTEKTGTGLGLAIARRAIEAQEGRIHAESPGLSGCHFSIRFPRRSPRRT
jgi:signal transduction histidine kinase